MAKKKNNGKPGLLATITIAALAAVMLYVFSSGGHEPNYVEPKPLKEQPAQTSQVPTTNKKQFEAPMAKKRYELPAHKKTGNLIEHTGFALLFNPKTNNPDWVAWDLTAQEVTTKNAERSNEFKGDPQVSATHRVETFHYKKSGFDRGHMCPAADMKWSAEAMADCFYMTNICPQVPVLNQRWWEHLEEGCRRWAKREGTIYICCGPIYNADMQPQTIGNDKMRVRVPDAFFKVVLSLKKGEEKAIGFLYANSAKRQTMEDAAVSVDSVESVTGYDFFPELENKLEKRLEAQCNLRAWN